MKLYRSLFHVHSDWSYDGMYSLESLREMFVRYRICIVMMSEHDRTFSQESWARYQEECRKVSDENITFIPGIEYSCPNNITHIGVWGDIPFMGAALSTEVLFKMLIGHNYFAVWHHPEYRDSCRKADLSFLKHIHGVEIWNRKADGMRPSRIAVELCVKHNLLPFLGLDFHDNRQLFPLWNIIKGVYSGNAVQFLKNSSVHPVFAGLSYPIFLKSYMYPFLSVSDFMRKIVIRSIRWICRS